MTKSPRREASLPAPLEDRLRRIAAARLRRLLDAFAAVPPGTAADESGLRLLTEREPDRLPHPFRAARDAYLLLTGDRAALFEDLWAELRGRARRAYRLLRQGYADLAEYEKRHRLASLTMLTAGALIPALCRAGRFRQALRLASAHLGLIRSQSFATVLGAGLASDAVSDERLRTARFILLSPVLWSVAAHVPAC